MNRLPVLALVACLGCAESAPVAAAHPGGHPVGVPGADTPQPFAYPQRPKVLQSIPFDYEGLPLEGIVYGEEKRRLGLHASGDPLRLDRNLVAELELGPFRVFAAPPSAAPLPPQAGQPQFGQTPLGHCGGKNPKEATLRGFHIATWAEASLVFVTYRGVVQGADGGACDGDLAAVASVEAPALVPGLVYAFRRCSRACLVESHPDRREELVVIGPPAQWVTSTVAVEAQKRPRVGTFTVASLELERGATASVVLHVNADQLAYFVGLRGDLPAWSTQQTLTNTRAVIGFTVEVTWPADGADPAQGMAFVTEVTPSGGELLELAPAPR